MVQGVLHRKGGLPHRRSASQNDELGRLKTGDKAVGVGVVGGRDAAWLPTRKDGVQFHHIAHKQFVGLRSNRIGVKGANLLHLVVELVHILMLEEIHLNRVNLVLDEPLMQFKPVVLPPVCRVKAVVNGSQVHRVNAKVESLALLVDGQRVDGNLLLAEFTNGPKDILALPFLKVFLPQLQDNITGTEDFADEDAEHPILVLSVQFRAQGRKL